MNWQPITQGSIRQPVLHSAQSGKGTILSGPGLPAALKTLVDEARSGEVLRVMSPVIDDPDAVSWLRQARQRGVVVRILTTLMDRHGIHTKGWDASQNIEAHGDSIRELAESGCNVRSSRTTPHGKFVLASSGKMWFGSANLSVGSLKGRAVEAALLLDHSSVSSQIQTVFDQIWVSSPYRMVHRQGAILIDEKTSSDFSPSDHDPQKDAICVWSSAPSVPFATRGINRLLNSATNEILLVSMSLYDLIEVPEIQKTLLSAIQRGVKVCAVVRKEHFESEERKGLYPDPATRELLESGMELLGVSGLHAKGFLVDDSWCGIQSANFNPYSLDYRRNESNIEIAIIGRSRESPLSAYAAWLRLVADSASHRLCLG
jgi:phosphatidylserine/phosphatidylglycerophosphate/cardiolipin synthase-like enzyme